MRWLLGRISESSGRQVGEMISSSFAWIDRRTKRDLLAAGILSRDEQDARKMEADIRPPKKVRCHDWPDKPGKGKSISVSSSPSRQQSVPLRGTNAGHKQNRTEKRITLTNRILGLGYSQMGRSTIS
jgi:hypothetical protein